MADSNLPADKQELMTRIRTEWEALMDAAALLTDEQMHAPDEGGWSPKDNLAHITEWMNILMGYHMDNRPAPGVTGLPPEVCARWDYEEINGLLFERNRRRPAGEVLEELGAVYQTLWDRLEAMSYDDLMQPRRPDDPEKSPLMLWVLGDSAEHFEEHREVIERALRA